MHDGSTPPADEIRSVSRAVAIVETVGSVPSGLTVKEIAERCGLTPGTARHLVNTLMYHRYLRRLDIGLGRYVLGSTLADRALDLATQLRVHHDAGTTVTDLANQLQLAASLVQGLPTREAEPRAGGCRCSTRPEAAGR